MYALTTCSFKPIDHQLSQPCIIRLRMRPYNSGVLLVNGSECPLCFYRRQPAAIFVLDLSNSWPQFIERGQIATGPEQTSNSVVFKKIFGEQSQNYSQKRIFIQKVLNAPAKYVCQGDENAKTVTGVGCGCPVRIQVQQPNRLLGNDGAVRGLKGHLCCRYPTFATFLEKVRFFKIFYSLASGDYTLFISKLPFCIFVVEVIKVCFSLCFPGILYMKIFCHRMA